MSNPRDFEFAIVGTDESGEAFRRAEKNAERFGKKSEKHLKSFESFGKKFGKIFEPLKDIVPELDKFERPLKRLGEAGERFEEAFGSRRTERVASRLGRVAGSARGAAAAAGEADAALGAIGSGARIGAVAEGLGAAAGAAATLTGGILAAGAAYAGLIAVGSKFTDPFAKEGAEIGRTSRMLGMKPSDLQALRGAGELAGVSADATTSAAGGLAEKLHAIQYGYGDGQTIAALNALGIAAPKKGEALDVKAYMLKVSDAIARQKDPYAQAHAAQLLGVSAALPFLAQGSAAISRDMEEYGRTGAAYSDAEVGLTTEVARRKITAGHTFHGAEKKAALAGADFIQDNVDFAAKALRDPAGALKDAGAALKGGGERIAAAADKLSAAVAAGGGRLGAAAGRLAERLDPLQVARFFLGKGYSPAVTAGLLANIDEESDFRPGIRQIGGGPAFGLAQWEKPRQQLFRERFGKDIRTASAEEQLEFIHWELQNSERGALGKMNAAAEQSGAAGAGAAGSRYYERPRDADGEARSRGRTAVGWLERMAAAGLATPAAAATPQKGAVDVTVRFEGAPAGMKVVSRSSGGAQAKVVRPMEGP